LTGELITPEQLADRFQITLEKLHDLRKRYHWPCVRLGRFDYRFTAVQVEEIVRLHTERGEPQRSQPQDGRIPGQTDRSWARSRKP
jgi:hypothetical protein